VMIESKDDVTIAEWKLSGNCLGCGNEIESMDDFLTPSSILIGFLEESRQCLTCWQAPSEESLGLIE